MPISPNFLYDLESKLRVISARSYEARNGDLWWDTVAKLRSSQSKREIIAWLLDSAKINVELEEGSVEFEDAVIRTAEYENAFASAGLKLGEAQFEDLDGNGVDLARQWCAKMGAEFAYFPQRVLASAIISNPICYDGQPFFSTSHPVSGKAGDLSLGTYSNLIPGKGIDGNIDTAFQNLGEAIAHAREMKAPDGAPRALRPAALVVPEKLRARATQLLGASYLPQSASGGGAGAGDVKAVVGAFGLGSPRVATELGGAYGGSDTSYYLVMSEAEQDDVGAWIWSERTALTIHYPSLEDPAYKESSELRWVTRGRNAMRPGHPYLMVKVTA